MILTEEEKALAYKISKEILKLANISRRKGILALDDEIAGIPEIIEGKFGIYLKNLLTYLVDGCDENIISEIGENLIVYSELSEGEEVLFEIILSGVLSIQKGENPRVLARRLASYFGIDEFEESVKLIEG